MTANPVASIVDLDVKLDFQIAMYIWQTGGFFGAYIYYEFDAAYEQQVISENLLESEVVSKSTRFYIRSVKMDDSAS